MSDLRAHIDTLEETYEFMLAYAAQGLAADGASSAGGELRDRLGRASAALAQLAASLHAEGPATAEFDAFRAVVEQDATRASIAIRLVVSQPAISSQLIDNLNASMHLRTLLTDLFLVDELLKPAGR